MKKVTIQTIKDIAIYLVMCLSTFLMLRTIIGYTNFNSTHAFLAKKQDYLKNEVWLIAFYIHVFTSLFTLIAGFTQFSSYILKYNKPLHRIIGKLYVIVVLFINVPVGFIMAVYANGLLPSKIAFIILDLLWCWFTWAAWRMALKKDFTQHKKFMIRSFALTFSAITLRTWKIILLPLIPNPLHLYMIDAWMGFIPNLLFAEFLIRRKY